MRRRHWWFWGMPVVLCLPLVLAACDISNGTQTGYTPQQLRDAYGVTSLINKGYTGKGQTVVVIDSYGSPTLQKDMDTFCDQYSLPKITLDIRAPLGTKPYDKNNQGMVSWVGETSLDVEIIHALAPDAKIVVMTSPVDETEGTVGLPEFLKLEQYAVDHHLGTVISQSWGASEYTLKDSAGQQELQQWDSFFEQATTQQGITFVAGSGDSGATDAANIPPGGDPNQILYVDSPTVSFPNDEPWVTSVGGTALDITDGGSASETAWNSNGGASGGGFSAIYSEPSFQQTLPSAVQSKLNGQRGVPDVAADADPSTGLGGYDSVDGWFQTGGTSAATPAWAALVAIGNQMAGHPLGFINPALYQIGTSSKASQDFRDITSGNNSFSKGGTSVDGYQAIKGWDPVTGLGSPIADHLLPDLIAAGGSGGQSQ